MIAETYLENEVAAGTGVIKTAVGPSPTHGAEIATEIAVAARVDAAAGAEDGAVPTTGGAGVAGGTGHDQHPE